MQEQNAEVITAHVLQELKPQKKEQHRTTSRVCCGIVKGKNQKNDKMTNEEINNGLDEMQRKIIQQSERIALLNNAIDEFKKQCDNIVKLTKTKQDEFNESVPDDEL